MSSYRMNRTSEDIKRELTAILRTVKDPRVTGLFSIVRVEVSSDLSYAKIYVSSMDGLEAAKTAVKACPRRAVISAMSSGLPCACAMCPSCASLRTIPLLTALISRRPSTIWKRKATDATGNDFRRAQLEGNESRPFVLQRTGRERGYRSP